MTHEARMLSTAANFAVVQLPGRNFPGIVVQGDTFNTIVSSLEEMQRMLKAGDLAELAEEIETLEEQLGDALTHYESICEENGIELPYPR